MDPAKGLVAIPQLLAKALQSRAAGSQLVASAAELAAAVISVAGLASLRLNQALLAPDKPAKPDCGAHDGAGNRRVRRLE
jgi:hypothetical protein